MAVQSPNQYISGPSMWAEVPDVPGQLLQGYQQLLQQQATPDEEELRKALALREQYMQERGNAAPTYMPSDATMAYGQGSLASVPHTAGYAGPTRVSDLLFPQPVQLRTTAGNVPLPGAPGRKTGELTDLLAASKGASKEGQDALMRGLGMDIPDPRIEAARIRAEAVRDAQGNRQNTILQQRMNNAGLYYNKKTGNTLAEDFIDTVPTNEIIERDYIPLKTEQQRNDLKAVQGIDQQLSEYQRILKEIPMPEDASATGKLGQMASIKWKSFIGEEKVRELESLQARLMGLARAFGGTSKNIDTQRELDRLEKAIPSALDNRKAADSVIRQLEQFRDTAAKSLPIPGLHNRYQGQQLDPNTAAALLSEAGGDRDKARALARQRGYKF